MDTKRGYGYYVLQRTESICSFISRHIIKGGRKGSTATIVWAAAHSSGLNNLITARLLREGLYLAVSRILNERST